jgi:hypothetical protein
LIFALPLQAEIYRWVDANGNVVFTDEPHPDAETIDLPPSTTYSPSPDEAAADDILKLSPDDNADAVETLPDYEIRVVTPANDESIWVNNGNVSISLIVDPELDPERGDVVQLQLDDSNVGEPQALTAFQLNNLSRGTHTVSAQVLDASGAVLATSEPVSFTLHRASKLNNPSSGNNTPSP